MSDIVNKVKVTYSVTTCSSEYLLLKLFWCARQLIASMNFNLAVLVAN